MIMKIIFKIDFELIIRNFEYKLFVFMYNDQKRLNKNYYLQILKKPMEYKNKINFLNIFRNEITCKSPLIFLITNL